MVSGSADLHGSNKNYIAGGNNFGNPKIEGKDFQGRNMYFGIREHAMGTMLNGIMYVGRSLGEVISRVRVRVDIGVARMR